MDRNRTARNSGNYSTPNKPSWALDYSYSTREFIIGAMAALVLLAIPNLLALLKCWGVW